MACRAVQSARAMSLLTALFKFCAALLSGLILFVLGLWAFGALWFDLPITRPWLPIGFVILTLALVLWFRTRFRWIPAAAIPSLAVLIWWNTLQPSNDRDWQPDVARTATAEISGDTVVVQNIRNFNRTGPTPVEQWETRSFNLKNLTGADIFINYWGADLLAHPIVSFQFSDTLPLAFSIEIRREKGEDYSAIGGLYRRFELVFIAADERDLVGIRTQPGSVETLFLYKTTLSPDAARQRLLEYLDTLNSLSGTPRWYNAVASNCTTSIRAQHPKQERTRWDWRILVNGYMDEMFFENDLIENGGLPFPELKRRALINDAVRSAGASEDFSNLIRRNRPGFDL